MVNKAYLKLVSSLIILFFCSAAGSFLGAQRHPSELGPPQPLKFTPPAIQKFAVGKGITVYYIEDRELPTVNLVAYFRTGSLYEPEDKVGLASLTGTVMSSPVTARMTGDQIDEELEYLAARVETNIGEEFGQFTLSCLKKDFQRVLEIGADILMTPAFSQEKIELAKNQMKESIRRRWDMPFSVANLIYMEKLYGAQSPYARRTTASTVDNISREDLLAFHKKYFVPNNMVVGITGDISSAEVKKAMDRAFQKWTPKKIDFPAVPPVEDRVKKVIYYVYKDTPQANIVLGHLGIKYNHPDQYKLEILDYVLGGGGFSSRLMRELRSNRGWTYGIYGGVFPGPDRGPFRIASTLRAEVLGEALPLIHTIVKSLQTEPIKDEEMEEAKNYMINSFVFNFESKLSILVQKISYLLRGYPEDYLEKYVDNIKKVTKEEVLEAARKHLEPDRMMVVVCGDKKRFDKPLETFGLVEEVELQKIIDKERAGTVK